MKKLKALFLCGVLALSSCDLGLLPKVDGIQCTQEVSELVDSVRNANEYGGYIISQAESLGVKIEVDSSLYFQGLYIPKTNTIILRELNEGTLVHEIVHRIQHSLGLTQKKLSTNRQEYQVLSLYSEFDAFYKSLCYEKWDILNNNVSLRTPTIKYLDYYINYTIDTMPYDVLLNHYNEALGSDVYNPSDLIDLVDKNFIDYDENYVLTKLMEKVK